MVPRRFLAGDTLSVNEFGEDSHTGRNGEKADLGQTDTTGRSIDEAANGRDDY